MFEIFSSRNKIFICPQNGSQPFSENHILERYNWQHILVVELLRSKPGNDTKIPSTSEYQQSYKVSRCAPISTEVLKPH
jgi:hypothetical protein